MGRGFKIFATLLVALFAAAYQMYIKQFLAVSGIYPARKIQSIGSERCDAVRGIEACEKIILHQPTGLVYMACSFASKRRQWSPSFDRLNPAGAGSDYIAQYNPSTKQTIRMKFAGLEPNRLSSLGFDVVTSSTNSSELWFYIINNRVPEKGEPKDVGADSVVQVFQGTSILGQKGSSRMTWVKTYNSQWMHSPNDVVGAPDGKSFYWTNDHGSATGKMRSWEFPLQKASTSVGYCHETKGCKLAASNLVASNGITTNGNGTYYVASLAGSIQAFEEQKDHTFTLLDTIKLDRPVDNVALAADGALYAGGYPQLQEAIKNFDNAKVKAASSGLKITKNGGRGAFFGEKYSVETVFEDDGTKMPPASSVIVDSERKRMYLHGLVSPQLLVCRL